MNKHYTAAVINTKMTVWNKNYQYAALKKELLELLEQYAKSWAF